MGGTDADLDVIYNLADRLRRQHHHIRRDEQSAPGGWKRPLPPWMRRQDC